MTSQLNYSINQQAKIIHAIETLGGFDKFDSAHLTSFAMLYYGKDVVRDLFHSNIDSMKLISMFKQDYYAELGILKGEDLQRHVSKRKTNTTQQKTQIKRKSSNKPMTKKIKRKSFQKIEN